MLSTLIVVIAFSPRFQLMKV